VKLDCFAGLLKYNIIVECMCEIGLYWGLLKYNIIVECMCEFRLFWRVIEV
jgi:hypothetical protein